VKKGRKKKGVVGNRTTSGRRGASTETRAGRKQGNSAQFEEGNHGDEPWGREGWTAAFCGGHLAGGTEQSERAVLAGYFKCGGKEEFGLENKNLSNSKIEGRIGRRNV